MKYKDKYEDSWGFKVKEINRKELQHYIGHPGIRNTEHGGWIILLDNVIVGGPYMDSDVALRVVDLLKLIVLNVNRKGLQEKTLKEIESFILDENKQKRLDIRKELGSDLLEGKFTDTLDQILE